MLEYIGTGETWDGARINGVSHSLDIETKWSEADLSSIGLRVRPAPALPAIDLKQMINDERDVRINSGFMYNGNEFQTDDSSRENISGALSLSLAAIMVDPNGTAGLRWADPNVDFSWTSAANVEVKMTAVQCQAFCQSAMKYKSSLIKAARFLKDQDPMPSDYSSDVHWPSRVLV